MTPPPETRPSFFLMVREQRSKVGEGEQDLIMYGIRRLQTFDKRNFKIILYLTQRNVTKERFEPNLFCIGQGAGIINRRWGNIRVKNRNAATAVEKARVEVICLLNRTKQRHV